MQTLRASSAPLFTACPAAAYGDDDPICLNPNDPAGVVGTAVHRALADYVRDGDTVQLERIAGEYGLNDAQAKDMRILFFTGRRRLGRHKIMLD